MSVPRPHPGRIIQPAALALAVLVFMPAGLLQGQEVDLRWQLVSGEEYVYRQVDHNSSATPMGAMTQTQTQTLHQEVLGVAADGAARIRVTYGPLQLVMDGPMGRQEFDSSAGGLPDDPSIAMMAGLVGESFEMTLAPDGRVTDVSGMVELLERMFESLAAEIPGGAAALEEMMGAMFTEEAMEGTLQQSLQVLPEGPVAPGAQWGHQIAVPLPFGTLTSQYRYTLTEVASEGGRQVARIDVTGTTGEFEPDPTSPIAGMMELSGGDLRGEMTFDVDRGLLLNSSITSVLSISMMGQAFETETTQEMELIEG